MKLESIGTFRLLLKTGVYLDLKETYVVPSFRRNLISIYVLDKSGYYCSFGNSKFSLSLNSNDIGTGSLSVHDNLICWILLPHLMKHCIQIHKVQNINSLIMIL